MTRVLFYQLSRDPAEAVVPVLAAKTLAAGERMLVVSGDVAQHARLSEALWARPDSFLAHGAAGSPDEARQPVLLADDCSAANGAKFVALADGVWREAALGFERAFLLFGDATIEAARGVWRQLDGAEGIEREYWKQDGGKWVKAA